ncbi:MAG: hypothetical protein RMK97_02000 [Sutterellaceae bacterium]|nr:hypothetical protein [Burkholderiaceae bacterium]MDW8429267.1 hypothetical protein [Sutterellaceae bacterium]
MPRRRFIQWEGRLYEVGVDELPESYYTQRGRDSLQSQDGLLWNDRAYDGLRATDGTDISSRSKHREYMRVHGLTTIDDFKNEWERAAKRRAEYYTTGGDHRARREAVERALYQVLNRRR